MIVDMGTKARPPIDRFAEQLRVQDSGCWHLTTTPDAAGYARLYIAGQGQVYAHRWAYETFVAPIPEGLCIDHLCRNRRCVNSEHMEPVTRGENVRRGAAMEVQAFCGHGHSMDGDNLYISPQGRRYCKACSRQRNREYEARKKLAA